MDDYISREDAKLAVVDVAQSRENGFQWGETVTFTPSQIIGLINKIPAADVQPVRHGRWVTREVLVNPIDGIWRTLVECSECGGEAFKHEVYGYQRDNFCHLCGADMRETKK